MYFQQETEIASAVTDLTTPHMIVNKAHQKLGHSDVQVKRKVVTALGWELTRGMMKV
jgi:hypothetical protein